MKIGDLIKGLMDWKSFLSSIGAILVTLGAMATYVETWVEGVSKDIYKNVTTPAYLSLEYDLLKQLEKLAEDPKDIKDMDVQKFTKLCDKDAYFKEEYISDSPNSRGLKIACEKILDISDERYGL